MKSLARALSAEVLKLKRTLALWLVVIAPLTVALLQFLLFVRPSFSFAKGAVPWQWLMSGVLSLWGLLMLPLFVTLETALVSGLEHGEKQWKHLFALPIPRWAIYLAKLLVNVGLIGLSTIILWVSTLAAGVLLQWLRPRLGFAGPVPWLEMLKTALLIYLSAWLILALHTWVSMRWPSFVLAIGVGMTATVGGMIVSNSMKWAKVYPWSLPINILAKSGTNVPLALALGVIGGIVVGLVGCWEVTRRDVS